MSVSNTDPASLKDDYEKAQNALDDLADKAPDEIKSDVQTLSNALGTLIEVFESVDYDFTKLAQDRMSERFDTEGMVGPWTVEIEQSLANQPRYVDGIREAFRKSGLKGWEKDFAVLEKQLAQHAECLSGYPDASRRLLALAARTESYREVLAYTIERMGGRIPSVIPNPRDGRSNWERLLIDRDDLKDGGAEHFVRCISAVRRHSPHTTIEILIPDFRGRLERALEILTAAPPDVLNHNLETVPRLYRKARPGGD